MSAENSGPAPAAVGAKDKWLFWACFVALVATSFGFIIRAFLIPTWGEQFALTETQKGEIFGVGLWPFAISIILFSLIIDKIGYGRAMVFAFVCHVLSAIITIKATGYWWLYWGNFIVALANGTVEAVINPVIATVFAKEKTKWLNILHAGWPGGLVLGGVLQLAMGNADWRTKVALLFLPTIAYGLMMLSCKWPVQERVAAGVSYDEMLQEFGVIGALVCSLLVCKELGRVAQGFFPGIPNAVPWAVAIVLTMLFGARVKFALGRGLFILLLLVMIPLATTELGVDSWVTDLMTPQLGKYAGWVLVYTSFLMMVLRFLAGPIVHKLSPLGLLSACAATAAVGLITLSHATGIVILIAATLYAIGKTFFWPTMLGIVSEQFPKGGALTLNATGGVGMLGVGVVGAVFLGYIQDTSTERVLAEQSPALHAQVISEKRWVLGTVKAVDPEKEQTLAEADKNTIDELRATAKQKALKTVAIFPIIMLLCYLGMIGFFKSRGGYKPVELEVADAGGDAGDGGGEDAEPSATEDA